MFENDIVQIENDLGISLPESYKNTIRSNALSDRNQYPYVYDSLLDDALEIVKMNLFLRENGLQNKAWSPNLFAIGINGKNCYYFIITDDKEDGNIYYVSDEDRYNPKNIKKHLSFISYDEFIERKKFMQNLLNRRKDEIDNKRNSN